MRGEIVMKTHVTKQSIAVISFVLLAVLVGVAVDGSRKLVRYQTAAMAPVPPGPEMLNGSYDAMITTLIAMSGR